MDVQCSSRSTLAFAQYDPKDKLAESKTIKHYLGAYWIGKLSDHTMWILRLILNYAVHICSNTRFRMTRHKSFLFKDKSIRAIFRK